ncbi:MAG: BREX-1 system adenine-specific DNA-methyltransferase PglX [Rubripirellula sp.]
MDAELKKVLKSVVLEMRHELEGYYDSTGKWFPGDLEQRLAEIGVRKDRESAPADELALSDEDVAARKVIDAYISLRQQAGVDRADAVSEYIRESAYTWANRLVALRCMEARELLDDEVIVGREAYGGRSLVHHRLAQTSPELCTGEDDGRFAMLFGVFAERAETLPMLFDPESPSIALRPSPPALKNCLAWLSGTAKARSQEPATDAVFAAPDALGWAYQYWNTEEKDRVFETVRTKKGAKIEGADIIPATQLYTEDYMVKFLVQNSLGATWMGMHPDSQLLESWEYYVRDADRAPTKKEPLRKITLLDPACGSGHFLIEAFDMFFAMYEEEGEISEPEDICNSILENNLFGIDIDERAIQIAEASLWMKAEEKAFGFSGANTNLVAATSSHLKGESWERYLAKLEKEPSTVRVLRRFAKEMEHIDELGSLARPAEALEAIIKQEHELWEEQERERREADKSLFKEIRDDLLASQLPFQDISDQEFFERTMRHALFAIDGFTSEARKSGEFNDQLMGVEAKTGFRLLNLLSRKYDVVVANPPYMSSKNQSSVLLGHIKAFYPDSAFDLFAAFIERIIQLTCDSGAFSCVTMQSYMFLSSFEKLREGLVKDQGLTHLVLLGSRAFSEIGGEVVSTAFTIGRKSCIGLQGVGIRIQSVEDKASALRSQTQVVKFDSRLISLLPGCPFAFWLPTSVSQILEQGTKLADRADVVLGMKTSDNLRFHREWHEPPACSDRWLPLTKSVAGSRYFSGPSRSVDWSPAARIYYGAYFSAQLPNKKYWYQEGVGYTDVSTSSFCAQYMRRGGMSDFKANLVALHESSSPFAATAYLNSSFARYLLWIFNPSMGYQPNDLQRLPLTDSMLSFNGALSTLGSMLIELKSMECTERLSSREFQPHEFRSRFLGRSLAEGLQELQETKEMRWLQLAEIELQVDDTVFAFFDIDDMLREEIWEEHGTPIWRLPELQETDTTLRAAITNFLHTGELNVDEAPVTSSPQRIRETFIDECAAFFGVHPRTIHETSKSIGYRHLPLWRDALSDLVTCNILAHLGHLWPLQIEAQELAPDWADDDGIIPITEITKETTLQERIVSQFCDDGIDASDFPEVMAKTLENWLTTEFFKAHIKQFKKRPIAWQLQTSSFTARNTPAFACLAYYHRMDADAIAKIRTQYTGPLKLRFETEMRGISSTPTANRTNNQAKRAVELEESIAELQAFDDKLVAIAKSGFGPSKLRPKLRQYAFDDAMLAMKARWLKRLSELLNKPAADPSLEIEPGSRSLSQIESWQEQANETGLHPELAAWITNALSHLDYFCSLVGPKAPEANNAPKDPTAIDFAELIRPETAAMQTRSIELACGVWWGKFDDAVLAPIKERIKQLKEEQKELNAEIKRRKAEGTKLKGDAAQDESRTETDDGNSSFHLDASSASLKERLNEVKAKIKKFTSELNAKSAKAQAIRDSIKAWRSDEPNQWHDWLAEGPMFDQVSSLDERRTPPKTIAEFIAQESLYAPDINDGVRVNIAPLQKAGVLAADVLAAKDVDKAIADRAEWRSDERRWVRKGKLPQPGWWHDVITKGDCTEEEQ